MERILIAGGTGMIGKSLTPYLINKGYKIAVLSRNEEQAIRDVEFYHWDVDKGYIDPKAFDQVKTIINLTGENIGDKNWTAARKEALFNSRVYSLKLIYQYIFELNIKIDHLISSSAVGIYGIQTNEHIFTEKDPIATDFLGHMGEEWEKAALAFEQLGTKVTILRKGVVFSKLGGIYQKLAPMAKFGINPSLGSGKQYMPWIDIRDLCNLYDFLLQHPEHTGIFNTVNSTHTNMNDFAKALLHSFNKKKWTPNAPCFIIKGVFGELGNMLLNGCRVSNEKLKNTGFEFKYEALDFRDFKSNS